MGERGEEEWRQGKEGNTFGAQKVEEKIVGEVGEVRHLPPSRGGGARKDEVEKGRKEAEYGAKGVRYWGGECSRGELKASERSGKVRDSKSRSKGGAEARGMEQEGGRGRRERRRPYMAGMTRMP